MSEALINWFMVTLGGKVGKEFILFLISMVPILELRGGLLAAGPAFLKWNLQKQYLSVLLEILFQSHSSFY